jgi:hypothetical protein
MAMIHYNWFSNFSTINKEQNDSKYFFRVSRMASIIILHAFHVHWIQYQNDFQQPIRNRQLDSKSKFINFLLNHIWTNNGWVFLTFKKIKLGIHVLRKCHADVKHSLAIWYSTEIKLFNLRNGLKKCAWAF